MTRVGGANGSRNEIVRRDVSLSDDFDAPLKVALEWLVAALFRDQRTCLTRDFEGKFEC